jgi:hypothetical protein
MVSWLALPLEEQKALHKQFLFISCVTALLSTLAAGTFFYIQIYEDR